MHLGKFFILSLLVSFHFYSVNAMEANATEDSSRNLFKVTLCKNEPLNEQYPDANPNGNFSVVFSKPDSKEPIFTLKYTCWKKASNFNTAYLWSIYPEE